MADVQPEQTAGIIRVQHHIQGLGKLCSISSFRTGFLIGTEDGECLLVDQPNDQTPKPEVRS